MSAAYEVFGQGSDLRELILQLRRDGMRADMQKSRAHKQHAALLSELEGVFQHQFVESYNFGAVPITTEDEVTPFHVLDALRAKYAFDLIDQHYADQHYADN